jgi:hypothetical protein
MCRCQLGGHQKMLFFFYRRNGSVESVRYFIFLDVGRGKKRNEKPTEKRTGERRWMKMTRSRSFSVTSCITVCCGVIAYDKCIDIRRAHIKFREYLISNYLTTFGTRRREEEEKKKLKVTTVM